MPNHRITWDTEIVPESCTCGAQLPPDARFCHKCGKPQRDEPLMVEEEVQAPPPPPPVAVVEPPPIGFQNKTAVRVAMLVGMLGYFGSAITGSLAGALAGAFAPLLMAACGFLAVSLYCKRTGQRLSVLSGAHLGWITGLFGFLMAAILVTLAAAAMSQPDVVSVMKEQWKTSSRPEADFTQLIDTLRTPAKLAASLGVMFLFVAIPPAVGGALGAILDRR
jgi:hypothetical protein